MLQCLASAENTQQYSKSPYWLGLLNYEKSLFSSSGYKSTVLDETFFISSEGSKDPEKEFIANLNLLKQELKLDEVDNNNYICRFPARSKWIINQFNLSFDTNKLLKCAKYKKWTKFGNIKSISLLFASGYFGNPASFFGHPMLKFNSNESQLDLLNSIVNYGALTPENENPVIYVLKGLFGGYKASFTHKEFFYNNHNYTELELRDIWEYKLDLTANEIELLVDHLWEVVGKKGAYLFFTENCASKIDEHLSFLLKTNLMSDNYPQDIPNMLFRNLDKVRRNGKPIYKNIKKIPSLKTRLNYKYYQLNNIERKLVKKLIKEKNFSNKNYVTLSSKKKFAINDTLLDFYEYKKIKDRNNLKHSKSYEQVLFETLKLDGQHEKITVPYDLNQAPHKIHGANMIRGSLGYSNEYKEFYRINFRPALYDQLTTSNSVPNNSELKVLDIKAKYFKDKFIFEKIDIFSVTSMNSAETDLPGEFEFSWQIKLGLENQNDVCRDCLATRLDLGYGASFTLADWLSVYGLISVKWQEDKIRLGHYSVRPEAGLFFEPFSFLKGHFNYSYSVQLDKSKRKIDIFTSELRIGNSLSHDLRLTYEKELDEQLTAGFSYYW